MNDFIFKQTSGLGNLIIKPVPKNLAAEMIIKNHYSHKWNFGGFGVFNYGIFREENPDNCLGVAVYGYMKNPKAKIFIHPNPTGWMCELNRLWISDELGHNAETILIAASIKLIRRTDKNVVAVQSFADGRLGCGTIYKAANFKYYGYHYTIFLKNKRTGEVVHEQILTTATNKSCYLRSNVQFLLGDFDIFKVRTYRYIYPLCNKFKFNLREKKYPEYHKGIEPIEWKRNTEKIKENIIQIIRNLKVAV